MKNLTTFCLLLAMLTIVCCKDKGNDHDASGSFEAIETFVSSESTGKIMQLDIEEGEELAAGQMVGYIDSSQAHLARLRILQSKRAILSGRPAASVQTESLKKELANAVLDRNRAEGLVNAGVASQKQLDDAAAKVATLRSKIDAQENSLQTTISNLNTQGGTVDAQLAELNDQVEKHLIVNPIKGTVLTKYAEQYEMTTAGKWLYKIADLSGIILRAYITGDQLSQVKIGQNIKVYTDDGKGGFKETSGTVTWINDKAEFTPKIIQTKNERANLVYAIKVKVVNDGSYKIGMYGEIKF